MLYLLFTPKMLCILEDHKTGVGAIIWAEEKSVSIGKVTFSCTHNSYTGFALVIFLKVYLLLFFIHTHSFNNSVNDWFIVML